MISVRNVSVIDPIASCRDCGKKVKVGESVLIVKLGTTAPYDLRHIYVHLSCLRPKMKEFAQQTFDKARHEMWQRVPSAVRRGKSLSVVSP
jgi:CDP-diacylglycerol pyrophosphatase